jgi:hypothetical protein
LHASDTHSDSEENFVISTGVVEVGLWGVGDVGKGSESGGGYGLNKLSHRVLTMSMYPITTEFFLPIFFRFIATMGDEKM